MEELNWVENCLWVALSPRYVPRLRAFRRALRYSAAKNYVRCWRHVIPRSLAKLRPRFIFRKRKSRAGDAWDEYRSQESMSLLYCSFAIASNCGPRFTEIRFHTKLQDSIFIHLTIHQTRIVYFYMSPLVSLVSVTPIFRLMLRACETSSLSIVQKSYRTAN